MAETALNATLRILVSRSWPTDLKAQWALVSADGSTIEAGESEPAHWPIADDMEAVISGDQAVWHRVRVPENIPHGELGRVLANALEEKLIADAESQHVTVTDRRGDEARVLVIARKRLREIVSRFSAVGRPLTSLYSELQTTPSGDDGWHLSLFGTGGILRREPGDGVSIDMDEEGTPPHLLISLAVSNIGNGASGSLLTLHLREGTPSPDLADWKAATGLLVKQGEPYKWYAFEDKATNLLHGEFLPDHRRLALLGRVLPALWFAGAIFAADIVLNAVQVGWERHKLSEARDRIGSMFKSAFPNTPAVAPVMQVKKELDRLRSPMGLLRSDDALTLIGVLSEYLDSGTRDRLERVRYDEASLEVTLSTFDESDFGALVQQFESRGLSLIRKSGDTGKAVLVIRRKLR